MNSYVHQNWFRGHDIMSKTRVSLFILAITIFLTIQQILEIYKIIDILFQIGALVVAALLVLLCSRLSAVSDPPSTSRISARLAAQRVLGTWLAFFFPRYGQCYRCLMPWAVVRHHYTLVSQADHAHSVFAICEGCYAQTTPEERVRYYALMWADWVSSGMQPSVEGWSAVRSAVVHEDDTGTLHAKKAV